jgi:hypothetical protein
MFALAFVSVGLAGFTVTSSTATPTSTTDTWTTKTSTFTTTTTTWTCIGDRNTWDASNGGCPTYMPGYVGTNYGWCDIDSDNSIIANAVCHECGRCTDAISTTTTTTTTPALLCIGDRDTWNIGNGDCSTYAYGASENNYGYCDVDVDGNGVATSSVCSECGVCVDPTSTTTATSTSTTTTTPLMCIGDRYTWDAGEGGCSTYDVLAPGNNNEFCDADFDINNDIANTVCSECGMCADITTAFAVVALTAVSTTVTQTSTTGTDTSTTLTVTTV